MRSYGDYAAARDQFDIALGFDPNETSVLGEASRANFFLYDFERAQQHIDIAWQSGFKTFRDEIIVNDLQAQLHVRQADHLLNTGDPRGAIDAVQRLHDFLKTVQPEVVDDLMVDHLSKVLYVIEGLERLPIADRSMLESTKYFIRNLSPLHTMGNDPAKVNSDTIQNRSGELKQQGRTSNFGFLRDAFDTDTYVSRNSVTATLWKDMCAGRTVRYDIHSDGARSWAEGVALI